MTKYEKVSNTAKHFFMYMISIVPEKPKVRYVINV